MNSKIYLDKLLQLQDNFSVKIITGVRGVGKTTLLKMFAEYLKSQGVSDEKIIFVDLEETEKLSDFQQLYEFVNEKITYLEQAYLLFDEIQNVKGWENAVKAFFAGAPVEIYLTGSNEKELTSKLLKILPDNCDVLQMYPLSFGECANNFPEVPSEELLKNYLNFGGLPDVVYGSADEKSLRNVLRLIYYETIFKDVAAKYALRDFPLFGSLIKFLAMNLGKPIHPGDVAKYAAKFGQSATIFSLNNYLEILNDLKLFRSIRRWDMNKNSPMNGISSVYCADMGICNAVLNFKDVDETALLENAVCVELWRRGYEVHNGRMGAMSITFFATKGDDRIYIQVMPTNNKISLGKIIRPLKKLNGEPYRIVVSLNPVKIKDGIKNITAKDFLTDEQLIP